MSTAVFTVRGADWTVDRNALRAIRTRVFIEEQGVPQELEWDEIDARCHHVLAVSANGAPIGTGRLLPDGHVGRMAVLRTWRGRGVGSAILLALLDLARRDGHDVVRLNAQTRAMPFYTRHGFAAEGDEFIEAGISHRTMSRRL